MATLTSQEITNIINAGQIVVIECNGLPVLIDQLADIPGVLANCGFSEKVLADYIIVGSPTNGQIPSWNSTTSKLQWSTPSSGGIWGTITGTLSNQTDLQSALNLKANLTSPTFTGIPLTPTAAGGTNTTQIASTAFVRSEVSALVNSAPSTLDTLNELATALGNDPNFATTITNSLAGKANLTDNLSVFAATTSLQLKNLISDETGSESLVFRLAPTLKNIVVNQNQNNDDMILATRATDSSPTGTFINYRNAAAGSLFKVNIDGSTTITANSGTIFAAGRQGTTNPAFSVISSGGTDTTGISVTSAAAGSGVTVQVTSSGANEALTLASKAAASIVFSTNSTSRWSVNSSGHFLAGTDNAYDIGASGATRPRNVYVAGNVFIVGKVSPQYVEFVSGSIIYGISDGVIRLTNTAGTDFSRLQFGGTTSSFPSIKRNGTALNFRLADDTADAPITAGVITAGGLSSNDYVGVATRLDFTSKSRIKSSADGLIELLNAAETGFTRLNFGGTTSSFPALKRSSATLQVRLADDSDYAIIAAKELDLDKTVTAGGTTGAQTINKSAGTINFAAAANSVVVTNSLVTANSIIIATVATNDNLMFSVQAVAGSGSFTLYPDAAPFAETRVNFLVIN